MAGSSEPTPAPEVVVVGAGVAGLTAALYLGRYRRRVLAIHDGASRALRIPKTHNAPGFPDGIAGAELIERMADHARTFGATIREGEVTAVSRDGDGYRLSIAGQDDLAARAVIFATGIRLNEVELSRPAHEQAIVDHVLRYCPVCDGYEARGRSVGVLGCDSNGAAEALFLRRFTDAVTLMPLSHPELAPGQAAQLAEAGVRVEKGALEALEPSAEKMHIRLEGGRAIAVDVLYPALGCRPRAELALSLGATAGEDGCLDARAPFGLAGLPGAFAAGDIVEGLDQISVAMGHGAIAATRAHNWLRAQDGETLREG